VSGISLGASDHTMSNTQIDYDTIAEIYDLYVTADYDIPFFLQETANVEGPVLELTAGTGRLSLPLVQAGVQVTCVDSSQGMLDVLSRKLRERGLSAEVRCADVCRLEFHTSFRLAILPFQSFMEIVGEERQRQALSAVFACLAPGGRFICTFHNPAVRRTQADGVLRIVGRFPTQDGTLVVSGFEQGGHPIVERLQFSFTLPCGVSCLASALLLLCVLCDEPACCSNHIVSGNFCPILGRNGGRLLSIGKTTF